MLNDHTIRLIGRQLAIVRLKFVVFDKTAVLTISHFSSSAISIYMDTLNIFIRIVSILAGGGGNRRK